MLVPAPLRVLQRFLLALTLAACGSADQSSPIAVGAQAIGKATTPTATGVEDAQPVFRFAKLSNGAYFFTGNASEKDTILLKYSDFRCEGIAFYRTSDNSGEPVFRFANLLTGAYFYTTNTTERDFILQHRSDFRFEGSSFSVSGNITGAIPVHRLANTSNGAYLYTTSSQEALYAESLGNWRNEGVAFYSMQPSSNEPSADVCATPKIVPKIFGITPRQGIPDQPIEITVRGENLSAEMRVIILSGTSFVQTTVVDPDGTTLRATITPKRTAPIEIRSSSAQDATVLFSTFFYAFVPSLSIDTRAKLSDTGVTRCLPQLTCSTQEALSYSRYQDAMLGRDADALNNRNDDGRLGFSFASLGSDCIQDRVTGLVWEIKKTSQPGDPRDLRAIFSTFEDGRQGSAAWYINFLNFNKLCGFQDWRVPTLMELFGIYDLGSTPYPIDDRFFESGIDAAHARFSGELFQLSTLTSSKFDSGFGNTFDVLIARGGNATYSIESSSVIRNSSQSAGVRAVRGEPLPAADYVLMGDEVLDPVTGLIWKRCVVGMTLTASECSGSPALLTIGDAFKAANSQSSATRQYRVPNIKELLTLMDRSNASTGGRNGLAFPTPPSTPPPQGHSQQKIFYWSSSAGDRFGMYAWDPSSNWAIPKIIDIDMPPSDGAITNYVYLVR